MVPWTGIDELPGETETPGEESDPSLGRGLADTKVPPIPAVSCLRMAALKPLGLTAHGLALRASGTAAGQEGRGSKAGGQCLCLSVQCPAWTPGLEPLGLCPLSAVLGRAASPH